MIVGTSDLRTGASLLMGEAGLLGLVLATLSFTFTFALSFSLSFSRSFIVLLRRQAHVFHVLELAVVAESAFKSRREVESAQHYPF